MINQFGVNKCFVLSVGGSLIATPQGPDVGFLKKLRSFILNRVKRGDKFYLVAGGGSVCRQYNRAAAAVTKVKAPDLDWLGISATRLNAQLLKTIFGPAAHEEIIGNPTQKIKTTKKIVIASGYQPGWSTDFDAVLIAKNNGAKTVINLSNIDYAYDKDPRKFSDAKKLTIVSWLKFKKIVGGKWRPGSNTPFDPIASKEAAKAKMTVIILNGRNIKNLGACLDGQKFKGTVIRG